MARKSFSVHQDFYGELRALSPERRGTVLLALIAWAEDSPPPTLDPEEALLFRIMRGQIERISAVNSANGGKGGAPKGNLNAVKTSETTETSKLGEATENKRNKPPVSVTVSVSDPISISPPNPLTGEAAAPQGEGRKRFIPPSVDEVAAYCLERGNDIDSEAFVAFYASKGWKVGKEPMKDWRQAMITWERKRKAESSPAQRQQTPGGRRFEQL